MPRDPSVLKAALFRPGHVRVAERVGFAPVEVLVGAAIFEMTVGPQHHNPMGTLHGGILCDLADAAMGVACNSTQKEGESFTTLRGEQAKGR